MFVSLSVKNMSMEKYNSTSSSSFFLLLFSSSSSRAISRLNGQIGGGRSTLSFLLRTLYCRRGLNEPAANGFG